MFKLLRYFSVASGVTVAAITLLFVVVYARHERSQLVDVEERHNAVLARSLANVLMPAFEPFIQSVGDLDGTSIRLRPETELIDRNVRQAMAGLPVQKVKIYHFNGLTVYSSEPSQIGETKSDSEGFQRTVSSAKPVSKLSFRDNLSAFSGVRANIDLVETYVPILDGASRARAVFEIYTDVSDQIALSNSETFKFTLLLLLAFGALYAALFLLVRRADGVIAQQYNSLTSFNVNLEKRVAERTAAAEASASKSRRASEALSREVEERRRIEQELLAANADLEKATRAKSEFLTAMSHEIRTPINGVLGMTDIIRKTSLSERQMRLLDTAGQSAKSLLAIIDDILDFSRIEAGKLVLEKSDFDLRACIEEAIDLFLEAAQDKGLELTLSIAVDVPRYAIGDASRLRQAFTNILSNAVKFTHAGQIAISVTCRDRKNDIAGIQIKVRDTGIGILTDVQQRLFKPFERADSSISRRFGGTGLGLAITKHLMEAMGGSVSFASEPGMGSEFALAISLRLGSEARAEVKTNALSQSAGDSAIASGTLASDLGIRVLVAEDNPVNQIVAQEYLLALNCSVTLVEDGVQAVSAFENECFDLILMDCQMPEMDGLTATRKIRALEAQQGFPPIPIVAVTAHAREEDRQQCFAAGMDGFVSKPYSEADLVAEIRKWVGAPRTLSPANAR